MTNTSALAAGTSPSRPVPATAWLPAAVAGVAAIGLALYQVASPGGPAPTYSSVSDWTREGLFAGYLAGAIAAALVARRAGLAPRVAGLVPLGYLLVLVGVTAGMVLREDPDWFVVLGGPGVLLSTLGFIAWGVVGWRRGLLPGSVALLAGLGGPLGILGSELGLSVLVGGFWLWLAARLRA